MTTVTQTKDSAGKIVILGIQHMFAMFGATVLVPALTGLSPALALFCAGIGTLLFHLITGRKVPVFLGSSFAFIGAVIAAAGLKAGTYDIASQAYQNALPFATGGIVVAGGVYVLLAGLVKLFGAQRVRSFFPPVVTGTVTIIIGLMLSPVAISSITSPIASIPVWMNWAVAAITVTTMIVVSVFAKGFFRLVPILIGIAVGYVIALLFGMVDYQPIVQASWLALPPFMLPKFDWQTILLVAPIAIVTSVEHIGDVLASSAVVGKDFMTDPGLHRTLLGDGLATSMAGFIGGPANTTYSENTGVLAATRNYNPLTLEVAAVFAIVLAFVGKLGAVLQTLPGPVMGGISVVLFGMIAAVGLRVLVENQVDFKQTRNLLIIAVMLVLGLGADNALTFGNVSISGLALAAVLGIILNKVLPQEADQKSAE